MRLFLAMVLPFLVFFTTGRPVMGILALLGQITLVGWLPVTLWAIFDISKYETNQKIKELKIEILELLEKQSVIENSTVKSEGTA